MNVEIDLITKEKSNLLDNLIQLYLHNISEDFKIDFDSETCMYKYNDISRYYEDERYKPFFIKKDNEIAGFMLVDILEEENEVQEMFILNNYKKMGIASIAVKKLFDTYKGNWTIKCLPASIRAEKFWTKVIKEYTNDNQVIEHTGKYNRAEIRFNNN